MKFRGKADTDKKIKYCLTVKHKDFGLELSLARVA